MTQRRSPSAAVGAGAAALAQRPVAALALLAILGAAAAIGWLRPAPASPWTGGEAWRAAERTASEFDRDHVAGWIALFGESRDVAATESVRAIEKAVEDLWWIDELVTPFDAPDLAQATLTEAAEHPVVGRALLRPGGLVLPVLWARGETGPGGQGRAPRPGDAHAAESWVDVLRHTAEDAAGAEFEVGVTGPWAILEAQGSAFERERKWLTLLGAGLAFLIAAFAFRDVRAVLLTAGGPLGGVAISVGIARLAGLGAEGFTGIVMPLLVLTIGFTDSLHLVIAAARARQAGATSDADAAAASVSELAWPCALTSLTTAIGFGSLALTPDPVVTQFGLSCALATLLTFVSVVVVTPLATRTRLGRCLAVVRPPRFGGVRPIDRAAHGIERVVEATLRRPRSTAAAAVAITLLFGAAGSRVVADKLALSDLAEGSPAAEALARTDADLGGAFPLFVRADWGEGASGAELVAVLRRVREALDREPLVDGAVGPAELAEALGALPPPLAWTALAALPGEWRAPFLDVSQRRAVVHARIPDAGSARLLPMFDRVRAELAAIEAEHRHREGGHVKLELVGEQVAHLETLDGVTADLARSLALAALLILVTLTLAFRSWRAGLASVVPSLLPLATSAAGLAALGGRADLSTLTALTLSLGIAADDTIHVLARWQDARRTGAPPRDAALTAMMRTLPALALTTVTLAAAFGVLLTSSLPTIREFGLLAAVTLVAAFLADVLLLPALLLVTAGRRR